MPAELKSLQAAPAAWILTGMSGSGVATVVDALSRRGVACVDNLPIGLIEPWMAENSSAAAVAIVDARQADDLVGFLPPKQLRVLFLDATDEVLARRLAETTRLHPLSAAGNHKAQISAEREVLTPLRAAADVVVDTSTLDDAAVLARVAAAIGLEAVAPAAFKLLLSSFGFKYGPPLDADWVVDVRFLRNPFWDPALRARTGLDADVVRYVVEAPESQQFLERLVATLSYTVDQCISHQRSALHIAIGCTGGRHRSVAVALALAERLAVPHAPGALTIDIRHRDVERPDPR